MSRKYDYHDHIGETHIDGTPHVANPQTVSVADGEPSTDGRLILDIWCDECGQSGAFSVSTAPDEIQWA